MRAAGWIAWAGIAVAAGCAKPSPPPTVEAHTPAAPEQIEGRYRGIARLTRAEGRGCPRSGNRIVTVEGNALSVPYRGATASYALAAVIGPDGSIHGSDGRGTIEGQITGAHMDLTVSSEYCEVRYALDRL